MPILDLTPYQNVLGRIGQHIGSGIEGTNLYQRLRHPLAGVPSDLGHAWMHPVETEQARQPLPPDTQLYASTIPMMPEGFTKIGAQALMEEAPEFSRDVAEAPRLLGDVRDFLARGRERYLEPLSKAGEAAEASRAGRKSSKEK